MFMITEWSKDGIYNYSGKKYEKIFKHKKNADKWIENNTEFVCENNLVVREVYEQ